MDQFGLVLCITFPRGASLSPSQAAQADMAKSGGSPMKKPCDCCERYLNHLDERNQNMTCFLRRMTGNFKHNTIVPNRFLKHFTGELSGSIKLESPNGCVYDVVVAQRYCKMVLGHGWEAFLDIHDIKENDSLLLRHIEGCSFEVSIFDSDGCEKMFPCAGIRNTPSARERTDSIHISSSSQHDTRESSESETFARCEKDSSHRQGKTPRMAVTSSSSDASGKDISSGSESSESDDLETPAGTDYVISSRSSISEPDKERVTAFIQEIKPEVTVFVAIMRKSHVQPPSVCMAITKEYALAHFPRESQNVTLQMPGCSKKWRPKFYKRNDSVNMLRGKWLNFVRDNHVQEGDICLLYPTKSARKFTFTIHLLRATANNTRGGTGFQRFGPYPGKSDEEMGSEVHIKEEPTDGEHVDSETTGMHAMSSEYPENEDFSGPSQPPYIVPLKHHLSRIQKKIVEKKVRAIQSELPIYVAVMVKGSIGGPRRSMLELGSRYATAVHLPYREQTVVLQYMRKIWKTKMTISGGKRRFLSRGWSEFVRDNGLRVGDICLMELKKSERKLTMAVHVISREQFQSV